MLDGFALPIICAANSYSFMQWFACFKEIMHHPHLCEEEKYLWLWLATQSANNSSFSCSFTYEHISIAVKKTPRVVHRTLFRLRIMGFLLADIPIWYGEPTKEMVQANRHLRLQIPPQPLLAPDEKALILPKQQVKKELNLVSKRKVGFSRASVRKEIKPIGLGFAEGMLKKIMCFEFLRGKR